MHSQHIHSQLILKNIVLFSYRKALPNAAILHIFVSKHIHKYENHSCIYTRFTLYSHAEAQWPIAIHVWMYKSKARRLLH